MSDQYNITNKLYQRFDALWTRAVGPDESGRAWTRIEAGYGDGGRAYHRFEHVAAMLADLDAARDAAGRDPDAASVPFDTVELAVFFHDAVYDPRKGGNEAASAALFAEEAGAAPKLGQAGVERVRTLILATAAHEPSDDPATRLLLDLDLAVLGASPRRLRGLCGGDPPRIRARPRRDVAPRARRRAAPVPSARGDLPDTSLRAPLRGGGAPEPCGGTGEVGGIVLRQRCHEFDLRSCHSGAAERNLEPTTGLHADHSIHGVALDRGFRVLAFGEPRNDQRG